ncbi:MAG: hypothetical protein SGPRY_013361 [Prymnesium sp.]
MPSSLLSRVGFAFNVTAAHLVTLDFMELTSSETLRNGLTLTQRSSKAEFTIHSLHDLTPERTYLTSRGASLRRTAKATVVLAGRIVMGLDGSPVLPASRSKEEQRELAQDALKHVQSLRADPAMDNLSSLEQTLINVSSDASWLDTFLKLDGIGALLDVLSHSQSRFTQHASEEQLQARWLCARGGGGEETERFECGIPHPYLSFAGLGEQLASST